MTHVNGNGTRPAPDSAAIMPGVGKHMIPLDGHPVPPRPRRRWRWPAADSAVLICAAVAVLAVAAFAAIVSYSHFFELARVHGQGGVGARLSPLSADGLIAAASLVMLNAARHKLPVPVLARWMLAAGVVVTVTANVVAGLPAGWFGPVASAWIGAAISAWPAVAFIGSVEMAVMFVRDARRAVTGGGTARIPAPGVSMDKQPPAVDGGRDKTPARMSMDKRDKDGTALDKARAVIAANPGMTNADVARLARVSAKTVTRARNR